MSMRERYRAAYAARQVEQKAKQEAQHARKSRRCPTRNERILESGYWAYAREEGHLE